MSHKRLVVAIGTTACEVGLKILEQQRRQKLTGLSLLIHFIDTENLVLMDRRVYENECTHLRVAKHPLQRWLNGIDEQQRSLFYPNVSPSLEASGAGNIRYNGFCASMFHARAIRKRLEERMGQLIDQSEDGEKDIKVVIIASAIGGTGSGALEPITEMVCDAAEQIGVRTLECDRIILEPGKSVDRDLLWANAFGLHLEFAALRLLEREKRYSGRLFIVGWGQNFALKSSDELIETAATLARVLYSPITEISARFGQTLVNRHELGDNGIGIPALVPTHISLATPVIIGLGDLPEHIIMQDTVGLVTRLIGDDTSNARPVLYDILNKYIAGNSASARYERFLRWSLGSIEADIQCDRLTLQNAASSTTPKEAPIRVQRIWEKDLEYIKEHGSEEITEKIRQNVKKLVAEWEYRRQETIIPFQHFKTECDKLVGLFNEILALVDREDQPLVDRSAVNKQLDKWQKKPLKISVFGNNRNEVQQLRDAAISAIEQNIESELRQYALNDIRDALVDLRKYCEGQVEQLKALPRRLQERCSLLASTGRYAEYNHTLFVPALEKDEIERYRHAVSIFADLPNERRQRATQSSGQGTDSDLFADFRQWLDETAHVETFFHWDVPTVAREMFDLSEQFVRERIQTKLQNRSVLDVLLEQEKQDTQILRKCLLKAKQLASPSVILSNDLLHPESKPHVYVSADWGEQKEKRGWLDALLKEVFGDGAYDLVSSTDPTEITLLYTRDGVPMSALEDLMLRGYESFLTLRSRYHQAIKTNALNYLIFSNYAAEEHVQTSQVLCRLHHLDTRSRPGFTHPDLRCLNEQDQTPEPKN